MISYGGDSHRIASKKVVGPLEQLESLKDHKPQQVERNVSGSLSKHNSNQMFNTNSINRSKISN